MPNFVILVENDESKWNDLKGQIYHYPSRYSSLLVPGTQCVYYKGRIRNKKYQDNRMSPEPHYFGKAEIGKSKLDVNSKKADRYCQILQYEEFSDPVLAKQNGQYLEIIPENRKSNYWRDGVREVTEDEFESILSYANPQRRPIMLPSVENDFESESRTEGAAKKRYSTYYERDPINRQDAIDIHGLGCMVCKFNFEKHYGSLGKDFIHVHHNKPISETGEIEIDPENDLSVVCPNCHAMIHRDKENTLSIEELRNIYSSNN